MTPARWRASSLQVSYRRGFLFWVCGSASLCCHLRPRPVERTTRRRQAESIRITALPQPAMTIRTSRPRDLVDRQR